MDQKVVYLRPFTGTLTSDKYIFRRLQRDGDGAPRPKSGGPVQLLFAEV